MIKQYEELFYLLRGLGMCSTVLHIGAHPDDEEIGLLSYLTHKYGVRVVYWSATRGEGGQNKIGPHTGDALGLYRTWESDIARKIDGGECMFGPFVDFGYSKDATEGLDKWGRENLVREIVRAIRLTQPHIVVSRWTGTPCDGHGHHESIGQVTEEAFDAAGDPTKFPELAAFGLSSWRPLKLYLSEMRIGHLTPGAAPLFGAYREDLERPGVVRINCGEYDPVSGQTYQERAWKAYNMHQTQALGWLPEPGDFYCYFSLIKSLIPLEEREDSFFDGFDPTLTGLVSLCGEDEGARAAFGDRLQAAKEQLSAAQEVFRSDEPMAAVAPLLAAHQQLTSARGWVSDAALDEDARQGLLAYLGDKLVRLEEVTTGCLGLELEATGPRPRVAPGTTVEVTARLWNHRAAVLGDVSFALEMPEGWGARPLEQAAPLREEMQQTQRFAMEVAQDAALSCPYWLSQPRIRPYEFQWPEGEPSGRSIEPPPVAVRCDVEIDGQRLSLRQPLLCREAFPGGFRELPVQVVSPISLQPNATMQQLALSSNAQTQMLHVRVENNRHQPTEGEIVVSAPPGWEVTPARVTLSFGAHGESNNLAFAVQIPGDTPAGKYPVSFALRCDGREYEVFVDPVRMTAPGMTECSASTCVQEAFLLSPSVVELSILDIKFVSGLRYAYLEGASQKITESLEPFGISFHKLTDRELGAIDLSQFDAILVGHNGYLVRDAIRRNAQRLLDYVAEGGTLLVEFQGYGYQGKGYTPYPFSFTIPRDRVVYEDVPVTLLAPDHIVFQHPNQIEERDFDDWVVERGLYFFGEWDERYTPLMSCADPGESQQEGGFLISHYGRGTFLYNAYAFFRQIPAGVPGALRLFANILGLPEARVLERSELLRRVDIFRPLTDTDLQAVAREVSEMWVEDGHVICRKGDHGDSLYIVYSGALDIVDDDERVVFRAESGDCVGELAVLCDIPRTATMRAHQKTQLLVLKRESINALLDQYPQMARRFIDVLVHRLYVSKGEK